MSKKSPKTSQHQHVLNALYAASAKYHQSMKPDRWNSIIKHEIKAEHGFYPSIHQVRYALRKMAQRGDMLEQWHERGWYKWYSYEWNPDRIPF